MAVVALSLILLSSCSKEVKDRSVSDYLAAYLNGNKKAVIFGRAQLAQIMEKANYQSIPKVNVLLKNEMQQYKNALELEQGIAFVVEGPIDERGKEMCAISFARIKNSDSLANKISSQGLMLQKSGEMQFAKDHDMAIGMKENLAVFVVRDGDFDAKSILEGVFTKCAGEMMEGKVEEILEQEADVCFGVSLENTFENTKDLNSRLSDAKRSELMKLAKDSYLKGGVHFEKGQARLLTENLLSDELMKRMCFREDASGNLSQKLGSGKAWAGISLNMDSKKMEEFIKDFSPELQEEMDRASQQISMMTFSAKTNSISQLWDGRLGLVMVGEMMGGGAVVPEINFNFGLGKSGKEIADKMKGMIPADKSDGNSLVFNGMKITIDDHEIKGTSVKTSGSGKLELPSFASNFGKTGISFFVNLKGMNMEDIDDDAAALKAMKYIYMEGGNKGMSLTLKGKNDSENILKQIVDVYVNQMENKVKRLERESSVL